MTEFKSSLPIPSVVGNQLCPISIFHPSSQASTHGKLEPIRNDERACEKSHIEYRILRDPPPINRPEVYSANG